MLALIHFAIFQHIFSFSLFGNRRVEKEIAIGVSIPSVSILKNGYWSIKNSINQKHYYAMAILGSATSGKTWILEQLFENKYEKMGDLDFAVYYNNDKIIIDSSGTRSSQPISRDDNYLDVKNHDILSVEEFSIDFLLNVSNDVVLVIGQLSFQEQKLLDRVRSLYKQKYSYSKKNVYVIHNYPNTANADIIHEKMKKEVGERYGAREELTCVIHETRGCDKYTKMYIESDDDGKLMFRHFAVGNNWYVRALNEKTFATIRSMMRSQVERGKGRYFVDQFVEFCKKNLMYYIKCEEKIGKITPMNVVEYRLESELRIEIENCTDFQPRLIYLDEYGNFIYGDTPKLFKPNYDYRIFKDEGKMELKVDLPGEYKDLSCIVREGGYSIVKQAGSFVTCSGERVDVETLFSTTSRNIGKFELTIHVNEIELINHEFAKKSVEKKIVEQCVGSVEMKNGVLHFETYSFNGCYRKFGSFYSLEQD